MLFGSVRRIPIADDLRPLLASTRKPDELNFGRTPEDAFDPSTITDRALKARRRAGLKPITLHECRHTFASLMIAAAANPKTLQVLMGHASITITLDRYGRLMPGSEAEAIGLLNAYLARGR